MLGRWRRRGRGDGGVERRSEEVGRQVGDVPTLQAVQIGVM